ncbi:MAG: MFS transporter [Clostridia bacterium]|nr:MFS transporter [Clostridia bacterium]
METKKNSRFHYAWIIMFCGCCIVGIQLGVFSYTIGNFYLPLSRELNVGVGSIALYQTMSAFASALTFPTATKLMQKYGMRKVLTVATISAALAYTAMSRVNALWQVYLCAVWIGLSSAFYGGATVPGMINNWFAKNNGTIYGTCLAIGAFVGVAANPAIAAIINASSWRSGYLAIAIFTAVLMLPVSLFLVSLKPEDKGMKPYGAEEAEEAKGGKTENKVTGVPAEIAFKSPAFIATLICVPCFGIVYNITNHITTYASVIGLGATFGATLTSVSLIGSTLGKLTLGTFSDKKGAKAAITLAEILAITGLVMVMLSRSIGSWLLVLAVFVFGYGASTTSLMGALLPRAVFGSRDYTKIMSYTSMAMSLGVGLVSPVYGYLYDWTGTYVTAFCFSIAISILCITTAHFALNKGKKLMDEHGK